MGQRAQLALNALFSVEKGAENALCCRKMAQKSRLVCTQVFHAITVLVFHSTSPCKVWRDRYGALIKKLSLFHSFSQGATWLPELGGKMS